MDHGVFQGGREAVRVPALASPPPSLLPDKKARQQRFLLGGMLKPLRFTRVLLSLRRLLLVSTLLFLVLFVDLISSWPVVQPSTAFALAFHNPNPQIATPAWLSQSNGKAKKPNLAKNASPSKLSAGNDATRHAWKVTMKPGRMGLSNAAQQFVSSDGQLEVDLPANSLDANQLAQTNSGLRLYITQVKPGSGNTTSGQIFFGTYEFQFFDGTGKPVTGVHLLHPLTLHFHLRPDQQQLVWPGQKVYAFWSATKGSSTPPAIASPSTSQATAATTAQTGIVPQAATTQAPTLLYAQSSQQGMDWSVQSSFASSTSTTTTTNAQSTASTGTLAVQASSVTFGTQAPQATWGNPTDFQVGLNSGGLNYSYPLTIPPGPGGLQPSLTLNYSSGSVNEDHGWQSTAPWVGEGWSLDLGSISWGQENVTPNGTPTYENVWHINDPSGISGQLIPPDLTYSTIPTYNPSSPTTSEVWHTAPESHAKVIELMFNSAPCWRVYLPNGIMEEFGCTDPAWESYVDGNGNAVAYSRLSHPGQDSGRGDKRHQPECSGGHDCVYEANRALFRSVHVCQSHDQL